MARPYYEDELVTLYHGDCRDLDLAAIGADVLVTDPPYGIGATTANRSRGRGRNAQAHEWASIVGDDRPFEPESLLALGLPTVLWGANHYADRLPASARWLVWDKRPDGVTNDSADAELAWSNLPGPARVFRHVWMGMIRASERGESYHPTQKPVALMRWVLEACPPGVVLDPYAGAGATLIAAQSLGRRAIGVEIDEGYCEIAARRLSQPKQPALEWGAA